jgi:hypothetical protein
MLVPCKPGIRQIQVKFIRTFNRGIRRCLAWSDNKVHIAVGAASPEKVHI